MKHYKTILTLTVPVLMFTSCTSGKTEKPAPPENETAAVSEQSVTDTAVTEAVTEPAPEPEPSPEPDPYYPVIPVKEDALPSMDGSTSAIPLETAIKAKLFDIPYYYAKEKVVHNKTHVAFQNLLSGETDLIFSVPISESQQQDADDAGVHLNMVPVSKEAFVFVVNKNNPVDSLTQDQIRDIYSGKITNWSELGGNDEEIIAYQRNKDSGSQNYMDEFMEGHEFPEPVASTKIGEMGDLIDRVATYDNAVNAIGYSVYSYAAQMYENSEYVKLIAVDGITPSRETLADGSYPLLSSTYIIHRDNPSEKTKKFIDWILSDAGQKFVLKCGYLPVEDMEFPEYLKLYKAKGTGPEMPSDYKPSRRCSVISGEIRGDWVSQLDFIKDEKMRSIVAEDITECINKANSEGYAPAYMQISGENCYAELYLHFDINYAIRTDGNKNYSEKYYDDPTLIYDLENKKRITEYSDLFFKDTDFVPVLNKSVSHRFTEDYWGTMKTDTDFLGVTGEIKTFNLNGIKLQEENPYFSSGRWISFSDDFLSGKSYNFLPLTMVTGVFKDFRRYIDDEQRTVTISETARHEWFSHYEEQENGMYHEIVTESLFHTKEEIDKRNSVFSKIYAHVEDIVNKDRDEKERHGIFLYPDFLHAGEMYNETLSESDRYYTESELLLKIFTGYRSGNNWPDNVFRGTFDKHYIGYDPETGDPLTFADVFGEEFSDIDENYELFTYQLSETTNYSDNVKFIYGDLSLMNSVKTTVEIPINRDHVNMKYFVRARDIFIDKRSLF